MESAAQVLKMFSNFFEDEFFYSVKNKMPQNVPRSCPYTVPAVYRSVPGPGSSVPVLLHLRASGNISGSD